MKLWRIPGGGASAASVALVIAASVSSLAGAEEGSVASTINSSSVLLHYCSALSFQDAPECFMENVEILPNLQLPGSTVFHSVTSATECQQRCDQFSGCAYFTFRTDTTTDENVCILKPNPSLATSPIIALRAFESSSTSRYTYVSGPRECDQECSEEVEIVSGCGASAPGSCVQLPHTAVFDAECVDAASVTDNGCNVQGYRCCKQQPEGCSARLTGYRLSEGVALQSSPQGIFTEEHCWASCVATKGCTHWNYIQSIATSFIGGACFLFAYEDPTSPVLVPADSFETSLAGGVTCNGDFGLHAPEVSSTQSPSGVDTATTHPPLNGNPVDGTCFSEGLDIIEGFLYSKWGVYSHEECQELCQIWPGCRAFAYSDSQSVCHLKYTWEGLTEVTDSTASNFYVVGPRDCPGVAAAPAVEGCITPDVDIESDDIVQTEGASGAAHCGLMCVWQDCVGWSFFDAVCYIKNTAEPMVAAPGVASGVGGCVWPDYDGRRIRRLSATESAEILPSEEIEACALHNKDINTNELETIGGVETLESCHAICIERQDCFYSVYFAADQLCRIKYEGTIIEKFGSTVVPRTCGGWCTGTDCASLSPKVAAATTHTTFNGHAVKNSSYITAGEAIRGLSTRYVGHPSEWVIKGSIPDFSNARNWARVALLVLTDDRDEECFVSDLLRTVKTCWDSADELLPLSLHFQIIGVANHASFKGWGNVSWERSEVDTSVTDGHFELVNLVVTITAETDSVTGGHGVALFEVAGSDSSDTGSSLSTSAWPKDLTSPINFAAGRFYARARVLEPRTVASRVMFCVTGNDDPLAEICTIPIVIPPSERTEQLTGEAKASGEHETHSGHHNHAGDEQEREAEASHAHEPEMGQHSEGQNSHVEHPEVSEVATASHVQHDDHVSSYEHHVVTTRPEYIVVDNASSAGPECHTIAEEHDHNEQNIISASDIDGVHGSVSDRTVTADTEFFVTDGDDEIHHHDAHTEQEESHHHQTEDSIIESDSHSNPINNRPDTTEDSSHELGNDPINNRPDTSEDTSHELVNDPINNRPDTSEDTSHELGNEHQEENQEQQEASAPSEHHHDHHNQANDDEAAVASESVDADHHHSSFHEETSSMIEGVVEQHREQQHETRQVHYDEHDYVDDREHGGRYAAEAEAADH